MAGDDDLVFHGSRLRHFFDAARVGVNASAMKDTSAGQVDGGGHFAFQLDVAAFLAAQFGNGGEQGLGVGVAGAIEEGLGRGRVRTGCPDT